MKFVNEIINTNYLQNTVCKSKLKIMAAMCKLRLIFNERNLYKPICRFHIPESINHTKGSLNVECNQEQSRNSASYVKTCLKDVEFAKKKKSKYLLMLISNFIEDMNTGNTKKRRKRERYKEGGRVRKAEFIVDICMISISLSPPSL